MPGVLTPLPASAPEGLGLTSSSSQWGLADPPEGPSPKVGSLSCDPGAGKEAPPQADCISICVLMRFHDSLRPHSRMLQYLQWPHSRRCGSHGHQDRDQSPARLGPARLAH